GKGLEISKEQRFPYLEGKGNDVTLFPAITGNFRNARHKKSSLRAQPGLSRRSKRRYNSFGNDGVTTLSTRARRCVSTGRAICLAGSPMQPPCQRQRTCNSDLE